MKSDNAEFKKVFKKRIYNFVLRFIRFIARFPKTSEGDVIGRQLLRSGTSILANYVEASSASSKKDFINFFTHSLKSANESKVWLSLSRDLKFGDLIKCTWLLNELKEIANIIASSILTLKGKRN